MLIQIQQASLRIVAGREQLLRHPCHHGSLAANHQRRDRTDAKDAASTRIDLTVRRQPDQRAIEPAGCNGTGPGDSAFENVLAIEMRPLAIGRCRGVHDGGLLRRVEPVQVRHRRIEREEAIERQRRRLAVEDEGPISAQADPVGVADGRDRTEPIERASQHDDEHARIAALGAREPGHLAPCEQRAGAEQGLATARQMVAKTHVHLLWHSADMNNSASACWRLSARPTACFTSAETDDAKAVSITSCGSTLPAMRSAK